MAHRIDVIGNSGHSAERLRTGRSDRQAGGGRFLARGNPAQAYESGLMQRVVIIEFDSVEQAVEAHDSAAYQAALKALDHGADRDIRIIEGAP